MEAPDRVSIGWMVLYVCPSGVHRTAYVADMQPDVYGDNVWLWVLEPTGIRTVASVPHDESQRPYTWHWMREHAPHD